MQRNDPGKWTAILAIAEKGFLRGIVVKRPTSIWEAQVQSLNFSRLLFCFCQNCNPLGRIISLLDDKHITELTL